MENRSPDHGSPVTQVRIARPTDRLAEVVRFYRDALGLEQIASFEDHAGYDGVMLALPGRGATTWSSHITLAAARAPPLRRTTSWFTLHNGVKYDGLQGPARTPYGQSFYSTHSGE